MIQKVKAVQDESSHWYIIPEELSNKFRELGEKAENDDDACDEFINLFSKYRTGGCVNNIQLFADI